MLGPLPKFYRVAVSVVAITVFIAFGAWAAFTLPVPILAPAGATIGAAFGVLVVLLLLHEPHPDRAHARVRRPGRGL